MLSQNGDWFMEFSKQIYFRAFILVYTFCEFFYKFGPIDFALVPHTHSQTDFWAQTLKRIFPLKTEHRIVYDHTQYLSFSINRIVENLRKQTIKF